MRAARRPNRGSVAALSLTPPASTIPTIWVNCMKPRQLILAPTLALILIASTSAVPAIGPTPPILGTSTFAHA